MINNLNNKLHRLVKFKRKTFKNQRVIINNKMLNGKIRIFNSKI
jgi:hypothetical protein